MLNHHVEGKAESSDGLFWRSMPGDEEAEKGEGPCDAAPLQLPGSVSVCMAQAPCTISACMKQSLQNPAIILCAMALCAAMLAASLVTILLFVHREQQKKLAVVRAEKPWPLLLVEQSPCNDCVKKMLKHVYPIYMIDHANRARHLSLC
jgi:hypothetical protein